MNNLAIKQQECLDDDTFNFLVELRLVSLGSYHTLVTIAKLFIIRRSPVHVITNSWYSFNRGE